MSRPNLFRSYPQLTATSFLLVSTLVLLSPAYCVPVNVEVDPAWPSVGLGSESPPTDTHTVQMDVPLEAPSAPFSTQGGPPVDPIPGPNTPGVVTGFGGTDGTAKDGFFHNPPDTHMAVGTGSGSGGRVVMVTNSDVEIFNKSGTSLASSGGLDAFLGTSVPDSFDPKVLYDQHVGRFFIVVIEGLVLLIREGPGDTTTSTSPSRQQVHRATQQPIG